MRSRILIVAQDIALRADLARLLKTVGHEVELSESATHARRNGLKGFALAIVAEDGLGPEAQALVAELNDRGVKPLLIAPHGNGKEHGSKVLDRSDEAGLRARIAEALRPAPPADAPEPVLRFGRYALDLAGHSLSDEAGSIIPLTRGEFSLLCEFLQRPRRVLSRDQLLNALAGRDAETFDRSIDMLVMRLRRKIEHDPKRPSLILTVPGSGYKFDAKVTKAATAVLAETQSQAAVARPLSPQTMPERRQLTILQCALSGRGFAAAQRDPEDLHRLLAALHQSCTGVIGDAGGAVARLLHDGILAYFGYPQADEHQAERAIRAGLSLVETTGRIETGHSDRVHVHIGIATGLVVVGGLSGTSGESAALGLAATRAAGLASRAEPDTVLISATTQRLVGGLFRCRKHASLSVEPLEAWTVEGAAVSESRFESIRAPQLSDFVGREAELGLLMERWNLAEGGEGQVVLLCGEAGIGKSRIIKELRECLESEHAASMRLHCSPYYVNSAFYPIIDNLERALKFSGDDTPEAKLEKLEALIVNQYKLPLADVRYIASILSIPCDARYGPVAMTPQKFKDGTLRALANVVEAAARKQTTVILFEDAHWADPTTLEVIDLLVGRVARVPLLIVITHRPEFQSRWSQYSHVAALTLTKLTRTQSAAMVSKLASGKVLPAELRDQIVMKTDGVPLFVEELTKSVLEAPELKDTGDHYDYSGARTLTIPLTLRDSLMARLDRFAPIKEIAQIGAAIGHEFSYELIAAVAPYEKPELDQALDQLTASGLAFCQGTRPHAVYSFKHALVQDAAYDTLLKSRRQELHGKIAKVIEERSPTIEETEPELLALHYTEANRFQKAIPLWEKAGGLALKRMALTEAISHLNKGLGLIASLPPMEERDSLELDLRALLGTAWIALRGWAAEEVRDNLHPALGLANSLRRNDALLPTLFGLWANMFTTGRVAESLCWFTPIMDAAEVYRDPALLMLGHYTALVSHFYLGDLITARQHADQILALYTPEQHGHLIDVLNHDPKTVSLAYAALLTWLLGYPSQAVQISESKDTHTRELGRPFDLGWAFTIGATVFDQLGKPEELQKRAEEAQRVGRENSLPVVAHLLAPCHSGIALIRKRQFAEGTASLKAGLAAWEASGGKTATPYWRSVLAEGMAQLGDLDSALDMIDEIIAQVERPGWEERWYYAETLRIKGWLLSLQGHAIDAECNYIASLDWARHQQARSWELRTATSYARLMRDQGRTREAYELLAPIYAWFTEGLETKDLKEAKALVDDLQA